MYCTVDGTTVGKITADDLNGGDIETACETLDALYKIDYANGSCSM